MGHLIVGMSICGITLVLLFSGMPIAFALGLSAVVSAALFGASDQLRMIANHVFDGTNNFDLLSIPLYIFMGSVIAASRAGTDLYEALHRWLYRIPGGLGVSNVFACGIFAAMCGSSPATAAAIGTAGIPQMLKRGYSPALATGTIAGGGTLGILIPPSVTMIVYGIATSTSIGKLFLAGVVPGIILVVLFSVWVVVASIWGRKKAARAASTGAEPPESFTLKEKIAYLPKVVPFVLIIASVMVSLYGGFATATEAAAVGALSSLVLVVLIYRLFSIKKIMEILEQTVRESSMILMITTGSFLLGAILTSLYIPQTLVDMATAAYAGKWTTMIIINIMLLIAGSFLPPVAVILIAAPILHPLILKLGVDPILFGVIMTINMEAGLIHPPTGLNLFVVHGIAKEIPLKTIFLGSLPFLFLLLCMIVVVLMFPNLALWLPSRMIGD